MSLLRAVSASPIRLRRQAGVVGTWLALVGCTPTTRQVPPSSPVASTLEARCHANDAAACADVGFDLDHGANGRPKDAVQARMFLEKACLLRDSNACSKVLPRFADRHPAYTNDWARARQLAVHACESGLDDAQFCVLAARYLCDPTKPPKCDEAVEERLYRKAGELEALIALVDRDVGELCRDEKADDAERIRAYERFVTLLASSTATTPAERDARRRELLDYLCERLRNEQGYGACAARRR